MSHIIANNKNAFVLLPCILTKKQVLIHTYTCIVNFKKLLYYLFYYDKLNLILLSPFNLLK